MIPSPAAASAADRQERSQPFTPRSLRSPVPGRAERPGQRSVARSQEPPKTAACRRGSPSGLTGAGTSAGGRRRAPRPSFHTARSDKGATGGLRRRGPRPRREGDRGLRPQLRDAVADLTKIIDDRDTAGVLRLPWRDAARRHGDLSPQVPALAVRTGARRPTLRAAGTGQNSDGRTQPGGTDLVTPD
jgi:hypothetical protein